MENFKEPNSLSRIVFVDVLRGFSLYGIILAHAGSVYLFELKTLDLYGFDLIVKQFLEIFIERKFYLIFSFLFGFSFFVQFRNSIARNSPFILKFIWRLLILFIIGYLHNQLYPYDILEVYAILGMLLIPLRSLNKKAILAYAIFFFFIGSLSLSFDTHIKTSILSWKIDEVHLSDKFIHQFTSGHFFMVYSLFLLGFWAGLARIFELKTVVFKRLLVFSFSFIVTYKLLSTKGFDPYFVSPLINVSFSTFYICLIFIGNQNFHLLKCLWRALAMLGRMGLTSYIMQTVFFFVLFRFNSTLIQAQGLAFLMLLASVFFLFQVVFATLWFKKFSFGPLEWIWRSTTNLYKNQPLQKKKLHSMVEQDAPLSQ